MTSITVEKKRIVVDISEMENWEVEALREEIEKMMKLHELNKKVKEELL